MRVLVRVRYMRLRNMSFRRVYPRARIMRVYVLRMRKFLFDLNVKFKIKFLSLSDYFRENITIET